MVNTARTAIARKSLSGPAKYLSGRGLIVGRSLDYGCGRGFDADTLGMVGYDPNHRPNHSAVVIDAQYDTITCIYVLNTLPDEWERCAVLTDIQRLLAPGGKAYIAVRNDLQALRGHTTAGTWQGHVKLDLPILATNRNFTLYVMESKPMDKTLIAEWRSRKGKIWVKLYRDAMGHTYDADNAGGNLGGGLTDEQAVTRMQRDITAYWPELKRVR